MERIEKSVLIETDAGRVFDHLADPKNFLEIWPSLIAVDNVQMREGGKADWDWTYKMAGLRFHGRSETVEADRPRRRVTKNEKGIPSTFEWTFEQRDHGTEVRVRVDYEFPVPLLGKLAAPFLRRMNEREAETLLENLKERLETMEEARKAGAGTTTTAPTPHEPRPGA